MKTEEILKEREKNYGKFTDVANCSYSLKQIIDFYIEASSVVQNNSGAYKDKRESLDMICSKIGRICSGISRSSDIEDSWRDIAGYATLIADSCFNNEKDK